jgi:hypothetical protein
MLSHLTQLKKATTAKGIKVAAECGVKRGVSAATDVNAGDVNASETNTDERATLRTPPPGGEVVAEIISVDGLGRQGATWNS